MSYQLTNSLKIKKQLQYYEGAAGTYAVIPTAPVTLTHAGPIRTLPEAHEMQSINYRYIGSEDRFAEIPTGTAYTFTTTFNPISPTLLGYGLNPAGTGAGSIDRDLQFIKSRLVNGVEKYQWYLGARCNSCEISISGDSAVEGSMDWICKSITDWSTDHGMGVGTVTWGTNPTTLPWTNTSPGPANVPLRFNNVELHTKQTTFTVNRNLHAEKPAGETQILWLDPTFRDVSGSFSTYLRGGVQRADMVGLTPRTLEYRLTTDKRIIVEGAVLKSMNTEDNAESGDPAMEEFAFSGTSIRIETYTP